MFCILAFQMSQLSLCLIYIQITVAIFQVTNANINYQHIHLTSGLKLRRCLPRNTIGYHNMSKLSQIHHQRIQGQNLNETYFPKLHGAAWYCDYSHTNSVP